jgi:DNA-binding NarL/FixJ family response regulator
MSLDGTHPENVATMASRLRERLGFGEPEVSVLPFLIRGVGNAEIARRLGMSDDSVASATRKILQAILLDDDCPSAAPPDPG